VLRGGRVVDPASRRDEFADVTIADGRIVELGPGGADADTEVFDVAGALVVPGLVDLHTHAYWGGTVLGVDADLLGPASGVTTWVDCGSSGAANFEGFLHHVIAPARVRILPFVHLSYIGLTPIGHLANPVGELSDWRFADLRALRRLKERHGALIAGIKLRASSDALGANGPVVLPLAREAADALGVPLMVHVGNAPPTLDEVLACLREGDILTHIYNASAGGSILDANGRLRASIREAKARGVRFDVGHGAGSMSFAVAERAMEQGLLPDAISSDLHAFNVAGPVYSLPHVMAKFLALGMSRDEVLRLTTVAPADVLRRPDLGRLKVGGEADVAVFRLEADESELRDSTGDIRKARFRFENVLTICRGEVVRPRETAETA
jgi:dihydroorotase